MRRSVPLRRRTPLRTAAARRTSRRPPHGGFPAAVVELALERAQYACEICGEMLRDRRGVDWSAHHRRPRAAGGSRDRAASTAANCMILCGSGIRGCHGLVEQRRTAAYAAGWLVHQGQDPAVVPVLLAYAYRLVLLAPDGRYRELP